MTIEERKEAAKWFQNRASHTPMPGAKMMFERAAEALSEGMQPQWTPCGERLPEANGRYLVTRGLNACGAMWNRVYIINYSDLMGLKPERIWWDGNVGKSDFERFDDVIAWMPLPKPYGGESDV